MVDVVISVASKVVEYLVVPISQRATYLFCFKQFIGYVDKSKQELKVKLVDVEKRKEEADRKNEEIMPSARRWLDDVNAILKEVQKLKQELEGGGNKCFNVSRRYSLAKQMENMAKKMMDLKQNSIFDPFSQLKQLPSVLNISSKGFINFDSRKSTYNHVLKAIKDDNKKMVGLYGIGGSGKTTLAKQVGREMDKLKVFDKVIMTIISKPPNVLNIQQQIAEQIGLPLQEATQLARARGLSERLKNIKILLILDDVWECLNLEDIGIPLVEGCHILLTTRLRGVCVSMDCETEIELPLIAKEEAWELFKKHANLFDDTSYMFHDVGRKIIDECKELPIAIVTVGRSLKGKRIEAWEDALRSLEQSQPMDIEPGLRSPYACLKLSYDNLPSSTTKSLFLLCSIFPEDHAIHKEDLIRFGKGTIESEEIIGTMKHARGKIVAALGILLDSCLLMSTDKRACVKMHDLVRDVALWIARKQGKAILVDSSREISNILTSNHQSLKDTKALSLWNLDENFKLSNQLRCPTLEIILLQPHGLIEDLRAIDALKVLALITFSFTWRIWGQRRSYWSTPRSIVSLTNLHTLCLRGEHLGDISFLGELKGLEILDLRGSSFNELPAAIADMEMLKVLDMFNCQIAKGPLEVIGRCEQLEELYFWDKKSPIPENFSLSRLKRYVIYDSTGGFGGYNAPFLEYLDSCDEALGCLSIQGFKKSVLNSPMKHLIHRSNFLWLENCWWDHKDINHGIKHLGVRRCHEKRFIIDNLDVNILQTQQIFSDLITLSLVQMKNLEQVFQDSSISCSLPMLQELSIQSCPELRTCILTRTTITSLPKLRKLEIYDCSKVKWLFSCSLASNCPSLEEIFIRNCFQLERLIDDDEAAQGNPLLHDKKDYMCGNETNGAYVGFTSKSFILNLKVLHITNSGKKKCMFEVQVKGKEEFINKAQAPLNLNSKLHELTLVDLPELEYIWKGPTQIVSLHRLEEVKLSRCLRLKNIFTLAIVRSLPELRRLNIWGCEEYEGIFCEESIKNLPSYSDVCFPKLKQIIMSSCNKVRWLLSHSLASHCPSLEEIRIRNCSQLERLIEDDETAQGNPLLHDKQDYLCGNETNGAYVGFTTKSSILNLKVLDFRNSGRKKCMFEVQVKGKEEFVNKAQAPLKLNSRLCELTLAELPELEYIWKGPTQIVSLHKLENVDLYECPRLKNIFTLAIVTSLPELRRLDIWGCEEYEGIFCEESIKNISSSSSNVCFPKLKEVIISVCNKMRWLLSHSLTSHCPSLEKICIYGCSQLERLIKDDEAAQGNPLLHEKQDYLCGNETDGAYVGLTAKSFALNLKVLYITSSGRKKCTFEVQVKGKVEGEEFVNKAEEPLKLNSRLSELRLVDLPELEYIWKGPRQILSLHRLEKVALSRCPRLKNIFTPTLVTSLPELKEVIVHECEEWEGMFSEKSLKILSSSSIVCFPKVEIIQVFDCRKVKRLFSHSQASNYPSLKEILIHDCSQLEGVVQAYEGEVVDAHHERLLFPKLNDLNLRRLPMLREIYPGYEFNHILGTISIQDCPNICSIPLEFKASSGRLHMIGCFNPR